MDFKEAQLTYKVKLCTTHAINYVDDQNKSLYWHMPPLSIGNDIPNCLMRVVRVAIPESIIKSSRDNDGNITYTDDYVNTYYVECSNVINKSFVSSVSGIDNQKAVIQKSILGSVNVTSLHSLDPSSFNGKDGDNEWVLCSNPFGNVIDLKLLEPGNLSIASIQCTTNGEALAAGVELLDLPIIYELEIKLLPEN